MKGLVACIAYAGGRRLGEVSIPDISGRDGRACGFLYYRFKRGGWL